jgi:peptide subunit release factor RF-3
MDSGQQASLRPLRFAAVGLLALRFEPAGRPRHQPASIARWITRTDGNPVVNSEVRNDIDGMLVVDVRDRPVVLFEAEWNLNSAIKFHPEYQFAETAQGVIVRDG